MQQADILDVLRGIITADEAARRLKVSRRTIQRRIAATTLPGVKVGESYFTHDAIVPESDEAAA
jgi:excisionase family DNA binding protein